MCQNGIFYERAYENALREVLSWLRCEDTCDIGRVGLLRRRDIGS